MPLASLFTSKRKRKRAIATTGKAYNIFDRYRLTLTDGAYQKAIKVNGITVPVLQGATRPGSSQLGCLLVTPYREEEERTKGCALRRVLLRQAVDRAEAPDQLRGSGSLAPFDSGNSRASTASACWSAGQPKVGISTAPLAM